MLIAIRIRGPFLGEVRSNIYKLASGMVRGPVTSKVYSKVNNEVWGTASHWPREACYRACAEGNWQALSGQDGVR